MKKNLFTFITVFTLLCAPVYADTNPTVTSSTTTNSASTTNTTNSTNSSTANSARISPYFDDTRPWGLFYYHSFMTNNNLGDILLVDDVEFDYGGMNTLELSYTLPPDDWFRRLLQPLVSTVQVAGNVTRRDDPNGTIYEFDPYLMIRWEKFPWDKYVVNTFAFGDGISYATSVPYREEYDSPDSKRLLNFLLLEATFAMPSHPEWQAVLRIHHRCGAWGFFGAGNTSSNAVGIGVRYLF